MLCRATGDEPEHASTTSWTNCGNPFNAALVQLVLDVRCSELVGSCDTAFPAAGAVFAKASRLHKPVSVDFGVVPYVDCLLVVAHSEHRPKDIGTKHNRGVVRVGLRGTRGG